MKNLIMLIRREVWENRSLWITPLVIGGIILIAAAFGAIQASRQGDFGIHVDVHDSEEIRDLDPEKRVLIYAATISGFTAVQLFTLGIVVFFYLLDSLLSERKDRSILFWKSLPISDTEVVGSKLLTALVAAPVYTLLVSAVVQLLFGLVWGVRAGGSPLADVLMPWNATAWFEVQAAFWVLVPAVILWYLPIAGYLLLVSVWARKNAFLWAVLPWAAMLLLEGMITRTHFVGNFLLQRFSGVFRIMGFDDDNVDMPESPIGVVIAHMARPFTHYETWLGVAAAAVFILAVIRIRRYRDDS